MAQSTTDPLLEVRFPPGTPVCVVQAIDRREGPITTEILGVVEAWQNRPTGSWFAHGKNDRLWLKRLILRKPDGELVNLVIDESTTLAKLEAKTA